jgi:hypothetical protein
VRQGLSVSEPDIMSQQPTDEQSKVESELRNILRRVDRELRQEGGSTPTRQNPTDLVSRAAAISKEQVERVVLHLQSLSELLQSERERVNSEIASYIKLNDHALSAMQAFSSALTQLTDAIPKRQAWRG